MKYIAYSLMIAVYLLMLTYYIAKKTAPVREAPSSSAPIINYITINQHFHVIDSVKYFHEIEYIDSNTQQPVQGYLYKNFGTPAAEVLFDSTAYAELMECMQQEEYEEINGVDDYEQ